MSCVYHDEREDAEDSCFPVFLCRVSGWLGDQGDVKLSSFVSNSRRDLGARWPVIANSMASRTLRPGGTTCNLFFEVRMGAWTGMNSLVACGLRIATCHCHCPKHWHT